MLKNQVWEGIRTNGISEETAIDFWQKMPGHRLATETVASILFGLESLL